MQKLIEKLSFDKSMRLTGYIMLYCIVSLVMILVTNIFFIDKLCKP